MKEIRVIPISVLDKNSIYELVDQHDVVFHLAAILGVKTTMEKSIELIETNFDGTRNVLQAALKGKKESSFASTSEVYGKAKPPFSEEEIDCTGQLLKFVGVMQFVKRWKRHYV